VSRCRIYSAPLRPDRIKRLEGRRFGRLLVRSLRGRWNGKSYWTCSCDCGEEREVEGYHLISGHTTSCGCTLRELTAAMMTTHGEARRRSMTAEYRCWRGIKDRCLRRRSPSFNNYGGRGIRVCDRWLNGDGSRSGYECFLADVGRRPSPLHSLDRINNDGHYEPGNVRWATRMQQRLNRRDTAMLPAGSLQWL
jgi:hypothetical protein